MKPCFLQSDLRFLSAIESSAYLKLTQLIAVKPSNKPKQQFCACNTLFGHFFAVTAVE